MAIESGSQRTLDNMKRSSNIEKIKEKVKLVKHVSNIRMSGFFIVGFPQEDKSDILKTIKLSRELPLSRAAFHAWIPYPGSEITEKLKKEGKLNNVEFKNILFGKLNYVPDGMTLLQIKMMIWKAWLGFYLRPRILIGLKSEIQSWQQLKVILRRLRRIFS